MLLLAVDLMHGPMKTGQKNLVITGAFNVNPNWMIKVDHNHAFAEVMHGPFERVWISSEHTSKEF